MIRAVELTCLPYMCWHNMRFSQLNNCGMWVNMSRHLTCGFMAQASLVCVFIAWVFSKPQNYVTAASRGSFTPEMVLLISTYDLNQLVGELGYLLHLRWKNCYSSCSGVWKTSVTEVKREKRLLHLRGEVEVGRGHWCVTDKAGPRPLCRSICLCQICWSGY